MKHRGISLATCMIAILLVAAYLGAYGFLTDYDDDPDTVNLSLSILLMLNVLAVLGHRLMRYTQDRSST